MEERRNGNKELAILGKYGGISSAGKLVYLAMKSNGRGDGFSCDRRAVQALAEGVGLKERSVYRHIQRLEEVGAIKKKKGGKRGETRVWTFPSITPRVLQTITINTSDIAMGDVKDCNQPVKGCNGSVNDYNGSVNDCNGLTKLEDF